MGDRPHVPNVCLILTNEDANHYPEENLSQYFEDFCDHVITLRNGGNKDLQKVPDTVCPRGETQGDAKKN